MQMVAELCCIAMQCTKIAQQVSLNFLPVWVGYDI